MENISWQKIRKHIEIKLARPLKKQEWDKIKSEFGSYMLKKVECGDWLYISSGEMKRRKRK